MSSSSSESSSSSSDSTSESSDDERQRRKGKKSGSTDKSKSRRKSEKRARRKLRKALAGVKIKPPPIWDGKADLDVFDQWTYSFDTWQMLNGLSDKIAIQIVVSKEKNVTVNYRSKVYIGSKDAEQLPQSSHE